MTITYRYAKPEDAERLCAVEATAYLGKSTSSLDYFANRLKDPGYFETDFICAEYKGEIIGFAELATCFINRVKNSFLWEIAILPEYHASEVGAELLSRCEDRARERGHAFMQLEAYETPPYETKDGAPDTKGFYHFHGYTQVGRIACDDENGTLNMIRFQKVL